MIRRLVLGLLALLALSAAAAAGERIKRFVSDATINADGSLSVRETIVWFHADIGPKRGIFRDFPTRYKNRQGLRVTVDFDVVSVKRDGRDETFAMESISNGERVRIGDRDVVLDEGDHTYEILYATSRQLGFFDGYDELYWNVTGNAWTMPIDKAEAVVRLPPGAKIIQSAAYTGPDGAAGQGFRVIEGQGLRYWAETTKQLGSGEGFTVAVGFTKGIVPPPTDSDIATRYASDNAGFFALIGGVIGVFFYYLWSWNRVGRDPPRGTIIPLFAPPPALGPAGSRYVWRQSFDDKAFASAIVGLAVKGRARVHDSDGDFAVEKLIAGGPPLSGAEAALYTSMADGKTELERTNHTRVAAMRDALRRTLGEEFDGVAFLRNIAWSVLGFVLSVAVLIVSFLLLPPEEGVLALFASIWTAGWWGGTMLMAWKLARNAMRRGILNKMGSFIGLVFLVPFFAVGAGGAAVGLLATETNAAFAVFGSGLALILVNFIFIRLMKRPTIEGRQLLDRIDGFRLYLATAEEDRINALTPPEKTPALFEKYLPYALALDCENEWAAKFTATLAAAGVAAPAWYVGSHWNTGDLGGFTKSVGAGLALATASSHSPPGSSSGSGGGGSSGGGGGGGGGGSW